MRQHLLNHKSVPLALVRKPIKRGQNVKSKTKIIVPVKYHAFHGIMQIFSFVRPELLSEFLGPLIRISRSFPKNSKRIFRNVHVLTYISSIFKRVSVKCFQKFQECLIFGSISKRFLGVLLNMSVLLFSYGTVHSRIYIGPGGPGPKVVEIVA